MQLEARLRAFAAVARHGSFSRAAEELYVSQPAVSKHLASLERELGTVLLERSRRGASLTPAGSALADYVLRAEALLASARYAITEADGAVGRLTLEASTTPGIYLLAPLVARFKQQHPGVEVAFGISNSQAVLDSVRGHNAELGAVGGLELPRELETEPLAEDEIVVVGPPSMGGRRLRLRELAEQTWIFRERGSATRAAAEAALWELGLHVQHRLELSSWEAVKLAVASGAGVAPISRFAIEVELQAGTLAILQVPRWRLRRMLSLVRARDVPLTPTAERFLELVRAGVVARAG